MVMLTELLALTVTEPVPLSLTEPLVEKVPEPQPELLSVELLDRVGEALKEAEAEELSQMLTLPEVLLLRVPLELKELLWLAQSVALSEPVTELL
jgi:hypothetical protein